MICNYLCFLQWRSMLVTPQVWQSKKRCGKDNPSEGTQNISSSAHRYPYPRLLMRCNVTFGNHRDALGQLAALDLSNLSRRFSFNLVKLQERPGILWSLPLTFGPGGMDPNPLGFLHQVDHHGDNAGPPAHQPVEQASAEPPGRFMAVETAEKAIGHIRPPGLQNK